jgi:chaperone required for assembly of F1-ATPase
MLSRTFLRVRTSTHTKHPVFYSFRGLASTTSPDGSIPATATNRVCPSIPRSRTHTRAGAEATLTRFWKTVGLQEREDSLTVTLDCRPLKTPAGKPLFLPRSKRLAATLIVAEWENQRNVLKSHELPMVRHMC